MKVNLEELQADEAFSAFLPNGKRIGIVRCLPDGWRFMCACLEWGFPRETLSAATKDLSEHYQREHSQASVPAA